MEFRFAARPKTEIYVNQQGGITIAQDIPYETQQAVITFAYQDIPALIDILAKCAKEAEDVTLQMIDGEE